MNTSLVFLTSSTRESNSVKVNIWLVDVTDGFYSSLASFPTRCAPSPKVTHPSAVHRAWRRRWGAGGKQRQFEHADTIFPIYRCHSFRRPPLGIRDWELGSCNHPRR